LNRTFQDENRLRFDTLSENIKRMLNERSWQQGKLEEFTRFANQLQGFIQRAFESKTTVRILKSLHFNQIKERHSDIRDAHKKTFEWIFQPNSGVNFVPWLTSSNVTDGIYWITGKAGSGKSTLMKFIQNHEKTFQHLREGSPGQRLILATHYFWSAGTSLQKSQVGLFRTLLLQILSQCPEMIPRIVPKRWGENSLASLETWSRLELLEAFKRLASVTQLGEKVKICLFVDGLDEYDGDHEELAKLFHQLSKSPYLRLCLSSRPWQDFIDAFGSSKWKLRVQELTKNDIKLYVKDNLEEDARFLKLAEGDWRGASALAKAIQEKAHGVFLWVYLVVRSLLRGLVNSDQMSDLQRRLNELPEELEKYFELILDTIEPIYRRQTAQAFKVMLASTQPLPLIAFHFISQEQSGHVSTNDKRIIPLSSKPQLETIIDRQQRQLNASCKDLLYVSVDRGEPVFSAAKVEFLHRTVMDFLRTGQMDALLTNRSGTQFNANSSLCRAYWAMFRAHPVAATDNIESIREREDLLAGTIYYAKETERQSGKLESRVLNDIESSIARTTWSELAKGSNCANFLDIAVRCDLKLYIKDQMRQLVDQDRRKLGSFRTQAVLLRQSLRAEISLDKDDTFGFFVTEGIGLSMLQFLLDQGADPNDKLAKVTEIPTDDAEGNYQDQYLAENLGKDNPGHNRSVWGDFLFQLQIDAPKQAMTQEAWDMSKFLNNSSRRARKLLDHAYEACELMITYGARRNYQRLEQTKETTRRYLQADDVLKDIFPDDAMALIRLMDKNERKEEPAHVKERLCAVM